jgi:DNA-binding transcriptional LysR family regulator
MDRMAAMEAFIRVVDAGSFSGAAKQLRLGQPAVTKTIAQLEERPGVRRLLRSTHGLEATPKSPSGAAKPVLEDWLLPPIDLWAVFPTGRQASAKARVFASHIEKQISP